MFIADMSEEYKKYPMVTAMDLRARKERPRRVKMLMRDFIEGQARLAYSLSTLSAHWIAADARWGDEQTASTIPTTATSPSRSSSSRPASPSTSPRCATSSSSRRCCPGATCSSRTRSTPSRPPTPASCGTPRPSCSAPTTARPSPATSSPTTS
ncbi:hypothetical protein VTK73DRAFT_2126 [Phialemonium thermophilum]|uniref:Uncharacterized protein n=1 Tax=Phialemonium thermophilum TaxID=223376 RepID=A0ABR3VSI6_9PEZI